MENRYLEEITRKKKIDDEKDFAKAQKLLALVAPDNKRVQNLRKMAPELLGWRERNGYWHIGLSVIIAFARSLSPSQWQIVERCFSRLQQTQVFTDLINRCKIPDSWGYFYNAIDTSWKAKCVAEVALSEFGDFHLLNEYLGHFGNLPQEVGAGVRRTSREQTACSSTPSAVASVTENSRPLKRRRSELLEESEHSTVTPDNTGIFTQVTLTTASPDRAQNSLGNAAMAYPYHQTIKTSGSISTDRQHQEHESPCNGPPHATSHDMTLRKTGNCPVVLAPLSMISPCVQSRLRRPSASSSRDSLTQTSEEQGFAQSPATQPTLENINSTEALPQAPTSSRESLPACITYMVRPEALLRVENEVKISIPFSVPKNGDPPFAQLFRIGYHLMDLLKDPETVLLRTKTMLPETL